METRLARMRARVHKRLGHTSDRISPSTFRRQPLGALVRRAASTIRPDAPTSKALEVLRSGGARTVLVADSQERLVGIITEWDILVRLLEGSVDLSAPVSSVMTKDPESLSIEATLGHALELMEQRGYNGMPLVDTAGHVAGHLDARDVLEYIAEAFPQEVLNLPPRPHQLMDQPEGA